ncbi:MAG: TetR/AcrR family transcriptional regulator [Saprospiraceae bacterium]|nr:TetR/AcrR family transcriptional regulator [Saprospiraceae bacterium]MCF8251915.1 TetR/AcrR family transcriptional regulator [Saprospiraceae bacterium]MCF8281592.1 TetR/AcrR family transcriptional regulator [Bacteroidales bacterium]MCF8313569.1 TetR/AcrR family transcriptional regulator [Saprospiraceae bacterium]MCF8442299.1 TetR/AcrR family transcriptional regulator [Saprospiraceae bacterium]
MEIKDRQLEILEAAGALLNEQGIGGLTTKNLAKKVGFSESALYRHYGSKEEIIAALLQYLYDRIKERLPAIVAGPDVPPAERLRQLFGSHLDFRSAHPHFLTAVFSDGMLKYSPAVYEGIMQLMSVMRNAVGSIVDEGQKSGDFTTEIPAEELSHILIGSFRLLMLRWRISDFGFDVKIAGSQHVENLILLISKKTET